MPPVSKSDRSTLRKEVDFVAKDDAEQVATGIVMVPWAVDLQGDWERPETIAQFAEQFGNFEEVGEAGAGVMHAVFPDEHVSLERNEVLEESTEIGAETAPEGAWVQSWKFHDEELWALVSDSILEGYSIGAVSVHWDGPMEQEELPEEVSVPDNFPDDEFVWELTDGIIREVSSVDIPAVPDAMILETKDAAEKRLSDHLGNRDGFIEEALQRGHSEEEAERLWEYLDRATGIEGAGEPGSKGLLSSAGKAFLRVLSGDDDGVEEAARSETPDTTAKEGRTLSRQNRESLYATIDASLDVLQDAGVDHGITRFTDRDDVGFDLSEHSAREWSDGDEEDVDNAKAVTKEDTVGVDVFRVVAAADDDTDYDGDLLGMGVDFPEHDVYVDWRREAFPDQLSDPHVSIYGSIDDLEQATDNVIESLDTVASPTDGLANMAQRIHERAAATAHESTDKNATGGDTPDEGGQEAAADMTNEDENEPPAWAQELKEQIDEQSKRIDEALDGDGAGDGEEKDADTDAWDEAPEWAKALKSDVDEQAERIDAITQQSGYSDQLDANKGEGGEEDDEDGLTTIGKALS